MKNEQKPVDRMRQYEVVFEPKWIQAEMRRSTDEFRAITITVYAHSVDEAMEKSKAIVNMKEDEIEVTSVIGNGSWRYYNRTQE